LGCGWNWDMGCVYILLKANSLNLCAFFFSKLDGQSAWGRF
jgi:hypothetical protein